MAKHDEYCTHHRGPKQDGAIGAFGFLAYIGAAIYFISESDGSFWEVILGLLQAIVWPVYAVYHVLLLLGA